MDNSVITSESLKPISDKWGEALNGGFIVIPSALLRYQRELELNDGEVLVLMNLFMHWWQEDKLPYPSTTTVAKRMGVTTRTVQRHVDSLERKQLLRRIWGPQPQPAKRKRSAKYDLAGITRRLKKLGAAPYGAWKGGAAKKVGSTPSTNYEDF